MAVTTKFVLSMKFGKLPSIDHCSPDFFQLPAVDERFCVLDPLGQSAATTVRSGGTMWTIRPWRGTVYPEKAVQRTWPEWYGKQFSSLEFNATHYRIYPPVKMAEWAESMPEDFRFCPKFPQIISHYRRFNRCEGPTDDFIDGILALGSRLGTSFIQLPPHYAPKHAAHLVEYLKKWPEELKIAIEFRHPEWFEDTPESLAIWQLLKDRGIGAVISDTAGRRDALHMRITAPHVIVRFGGYEGHPLDETRILRWVQWINQWKASGLESFDFLVHEPDSVLTPHTCIQFAHHLKQVSQLSCRSPQLMDSAQTLF